MSKTEAKVVENQVFIGELQNVSPIRMKEPFAETLGAFASENAVLDYTYCDVIKMAGHACPTTAGAFLVCKKALEKLYPGDVPVRGDVAIAVYGEPDEGVYGVIGQVFSLITGAAPLSGFRGLGRKFKRKDLLKFATNKPDPKALSFEFKRLDTGKAVLAKFYPHLVPTDEKNGMRMGELMELVLWDAAKPEQAKEFQKLWMAKVLDMLVRQIEIVNWIKIDERS